MTKITAAIFFVLITTSFVHASDGVYFHYSHTKGTKCAEDWLVMEKILNENGIRCEEVLPIEGFPYLRGSKEVLKLAPKVSTKYAAHKWLELLRRIDLQARYAELDALPQKELKKFCSKAGIDCFQGRIRAYVARCSAIIMGDEKSNHDFIKVLKKNAMLSGNKKGGKARCFEDPESLDGIACMDVLSSIFAPPSTVGVSSNLLQKRIILQKNAKPY